ncbi:hypothetical protein HDU92_003895, partial [Lobulomyces angularis]
DQFTTGPCTKDEECQSACCDGTKCRAPDALKGAETCRDGLAPDFTNGLKFVTKPVSGAGNQGQQQGNDKEVNNNQGAKALADKAKIDLSEDKALAEEAQKKLTDARKNLSADPNNEQLKLAAKIADDACAVADNQVLLDEAMIANAGETNNGGVADLEKALKGAQDQLKVDLENQNKALENKALADKALQDAIANKTAEEVAAAEKVKEEADLAATKAKECAQKSKELVDNKNIKAAAEVPPVADNDNVVAEKENVVEEGEASIIDDKATGNKNLDTAAIQAAFSQLTKSLTELGAIFDNLD